MRQIWISKFGPPEVLQIREAPDPTPRNGEVRIRVEASGVSFNDVVHRLGLGNGSPSPPFVPGHEIAGHIDQVGQGVTELKEGDSVLALLPHGGYCDAICVPSERAIGRPEWMGGQAAAAFPVSFLMAYYALLKMGSLDKDDRVLIHGVAGGVGLAALDLCLMVGANVIGTAAANKHDFLRQRGLSEAIDHHLHDYEAELFRITNGKGVSLILERLGGTHWSKNYRLLSPGGRLIHYGSSTLAPRKRRSLTAIWRGQAAAPRYTPDRLMKDNTAVAGISLAFFWDRPELFKRWMSQLLSWYDEALLRPQVDRVFRLEEAAAAHHYLQDGLNIGKVILLPEQPR